MSNQKKRPYHSKTRQAQASQTRKRILTAAKKLFQTKGFEPVTIENLAQTAKVSPSNIYSLFQSKRGILLALMDEALPAEEFDTLVEEVRQEKSVEKRLFITAKIARQLYESEKTLTDIFRGAFILSPEFKIIETQREERRYQRQEETLKQLAKESVLVEGLSLDDARAIFWTFTGRDMYRMLVITRGWSPDKYEEWLAHLLINNLIRKH